MRALRKALVVVARGLHTTLVALVGTAFVLVAVLTLLGWSLRHTLLDKGTYYQLIDQVQSDRAARGLLARALVGKSSPASTAGTRGIEYTAESWEEVAELLIPETWLPDSSKIVIERVLAWVQGEDSDLPDVQIDLRPIIAQLRGQQGPISVLPLVLNAPACPPGVNVIVIMGDSLLSCLPMGQDVSVLALSVARALAASLPETVDLADPRSQVILGSGIVDALFDLRTGFRALSNAIVTASWLSVALLFLHMSLHASGLRALMRSVGLALVASGSLALTLGGLGFVLAGPGLDFVIFRIAPGLGATLLPSVTASVEDAGRRFVTSLALRSLPLFFGGVILGLSVAMASRLKPGRESAEVSADSRRRQRWREFR